MSHKSYWRERAKAIICRVLAETAGKPEKEIKKALRAAYPFEDLSHPYKIWLSEIKAQRKQFRPKPQPENQTRLF